MKTLYIIRHAKSSWSFELPDIDRPLGKRGRKDVFKVGHYLASKFTMPQQMITSPASRALHTALFISDLWGYPEEEIQIEPEIYHGSISGMINALSRIHTPDTLALFGHNPGLTDLANELSDASIVNIPTCGVVGIHFNINSWEELSNKKGQHFMFLQPKALS